MRRRSCRFDRAASVDRRSQCVNHAADHCLTDRNLSDAAGAFDRIALFDHLGFAEQRGADVVFFQVQCDTENPMGKFQQLAGGNLIKAMNARDTIAGGQHRTDFLDLNRLIVIANLLFDNSADFRCSDLHLVLLNSRA